MTKTVKMLTIFPIGLHPRCLLESNASTWLGNLSGLVYWFGLVYWGLTPQQQPGSYQGGEMMMMKSVIWWRKPEYPEETTDLRQVTDETFSHIRPLPSPGLNLGRSGVKQNELRRD